MNDPYGYSRTDLSEIGTLSLVATNFVQSSAATDSAKTAARESNQTRPAVAECTYLSTGVGQTRITTSIDFPVTFRREPHFTSGCATVRNPASKTHNDPRGQCGVWGWDRDSSGYYTGAYVWIYVTCDSLEEHTVTSAEQARINKIQVMHYLTFTAQAVKSAGTAIPVALTPRDPGVFSINNRP